MYPPPKLRECERECDDGWKLGVGDCISICMTNVFACRRISNATWASLYRMSAAAANIINDTTANE